MLKKVITTLIFLCLIFSLSTMAATAEGGPQQGRNQGGMPPMDEMTDKELTPPEGFTPPDGEFTPPQAEESNTETTVPPSDTGATEENQKAQESNKESGQTKDERFQFDGRMPEDMGGFPGNMQRGQNTSAEQPTGFLGFVKTYSTPITSVVLLGLAFIFVIFYRRKNY